MLIYSPLPKLRALWAAVSGRTPTIMQIAKPWCKEGDIAYLFSRTCFSLQAIALWWEKHFNKQNPVVWLPDYFCNQSLTFLRKTSAQIIFYPITENLAPDWEACAELAKTLSPNIFVLVHYFGQCAEIVAAKRFCKAQQAILVEDAAHVLLPVKDIGERGDFILYSPHKLLPVSDGAICVMRPSVNMHADVMTEVVNTMSVFTPTVWRWSIKKLLQKVLIGLPIKSKKISFDFDHDPLSAVYTNTPQMSKVAKKMLFNLQHKLKNIAMQLQENMQLWQYLISTVSDIKPFNKLDDDTVPYLALFKAENYEAAKCLYKTLQTKTWPVQTWPDLPPEVLADSANPSHAIRLRQTLITLPVAYTFSHKKLAKFLPALSTRFAINWQLNDRQQWEELFALANKSNLLQSWAYGHAKIAAGWQVKHGVITKDEKPVALLQVLEKTRAGLKWVRINRGPCWLGELSITEKMAVYYQLKQQWAWWRRCIVIFAPELVDDVANKLWLKQLKFWPLPLPKWHSAWVNLQQSALELRQALNGKWRNQLKSAEQAELKCEVGDANDLNWLLTIYNELQQTKKFTGIPSNILQSLYAHCYRPQDVMLLKAIHNAEIIAAVLIVVHGNTATYLVGWSNDIGRTMYAHNFLLWQGILLAQQYHCHWLDLGGVDEINTPGVAKFKQGINGEAYSLIGEYLWL